MMGENLNTRKNQYMASLLLKEDQRPERPEQGRKKHLGSLHKTNQKDSGSEEDIQEQTLLGLAVSTFPQQDNTALRTGLRQFVFMLNVHREYIDAGLTSPRVVNDPPASGWVYRPSLRGTEPPTTDVGSRHGDLSPTVHPQTHGLLGQFASIDQRDNNRFYRLLSSSAESPTTSVDLEHPDKNIFIRALFEDGTQVSVQDETKEIIDWYAEQVSQILEAKVLLYKQDGNNIEFVVVVDHIRRDHSFQLSDLACELDDLYPHWEFDFQYISIRTAGQLPLDEYSDISNGG